MTRSISPRLAGVLEQLELEQPTLVTTDELTTILASKGIKTPARVVASRLKDKGWFIATDQRGVWEFAPAAVAGVFSSNDPLLPLKSFLAKSPETECALTFQSAAWAHGLADRIPLHLEVAATERKIVTRFPSSISGFVFAPLLAYESIRDVPVLAIESLLVHMATKPTSVRSWQSAMEWLPELAHEAREHELLYELNTRQSSIKARTGYLIQGLRPDLANAIYMTHQPQAATRFGPREASLRYDSHWKIADTILPFDPRILESMQ